MGNLVVCEKVEDGLRRCVCCRGDGHVDGSAFRAALRMFADFVRAL